MLSKRLSLTIRFFVVVPRRVLILTLVLLLALTITTSAQGVTYACGPGTGSSCCPGC